MLGVAASVLMCGLAVVLVPTWWPHPTVVAVAVLLILGAGFASIHACFVRLDPGTSGWPQS
ncbi:hypothetical protein ACWCXX_38200 [Streptomyces sp. NPDC001732]